MRNERAKNFAILAAMLGFLALFLVMTGCGVTHAPDATPAQIKQETRLSASTEAHEAHAAAEDLVVTLHRTRTLTDAAAAQAAAYLTAARKSIDAADALLIDGDATAFATQLGDAWASIDQAAAIHSPGKPVPSAARKK